MSLMIDVPAEELAEFCRRNHIRRLMAFGSVLREDLIVEFEPEARVGLITLAGIEIDLSEIVGRKVDLNTPKMLSRYFRDRVLAEAEVLYDGA